MARPRRHDPDLIAHAQVVVSNTTDLREYRAALAVLLPALAHTTLQETSTILGVGLATVTRLQQRLRQSVTGSRPTSRSWGGCRRALMTPEDERRLLAPWVQRSKDPGMSVVSPIQTAQTAPATVAETTRVGREKPNASGELRLAAKALIEILHHQPKIYGINRSNWTLKSLSEVFEKQFGKKPSLSTVSRYLKEAGLRWKKSRKVLTSPDPNYREKVQMLLETLQSLKADEDLFFIDELGPVAVRRHGGRFYTPKGETPTHPQNQRAKGSIILCAALSAKTNQVTWFYGWAKDSAGMIELAEVLYNQHHDKSKIYLTWDAASWHRSDELGQWTNALNAWNSASGTGPLIAVVPLPSSSQFLNVIEAVFSGMKRAVIHGSDYQTKAEMKAAVSMHFRERNEFFKDNPKRVGKKIWEINFFEDHNNIRWANYRKY